MLNIDGLRTRLVAQLAELEAREAELSAELTAPLDPNLSEQAVELEGDDPLGGQIAILNERIGAVRAALGRMDAGSYGECISCGEEILARRLEAEPDAALCINCANRTR